MERESFEDAGVAALLNEHFVPIKVDREERPDIDEIYMNAVQLMTGAGGWPLSAFLTPQLEPFFTGTYFPPRDMYGRPGFMTVLRSLHEAWTRRREEVDRSAGEITDELRRIAAGSASEQSERIIDSREQMLAVADLTRRYEPRHGGFGGAPKFPPDGQLALLLREYARTSEAIPLEMAEHTLDAMALGGMYDHVGGGFARYSVDERWLVPHFEKMLYNQALLVPVYLDAWKLTRKPLYRRVVEQTLDFVRREMTDPGGGFYSSLDADSEGEEGKFYVWTPGEIRDVLGAEEGDLFCELYGISTEGNFEGKSIANLLGGAPEAQAEARGLAAEDVLQRMDAARRKLLAARERRPRPGTDDKVLTSWNGLMISAFARAYQSLGREDDLRAARRSADFVLDRLTDGERLLVSYRAGQARLNGYLDDHAFFGRALLDLYESCFDVDYLLAARRLAANLVRRFEDTASGGFYFVADDHENLLTRNRSLHDGALPSGAGVAIELLLRLAIQLEDRALREAAERALRAYRPAVSSAPSACASMLLAADLARGPVVEIAIVGPREHPLTREMLELVHADYRPRLVLACGESAPHEARLPLLADRTAIEGRPTAYVCRDYACRSPVTDPESFKTELERVTG